MAKGQGQTRLVSHAVKMIRAEAPGGCSREFDENGTSRSFPEHLHGKGPVVGQVPEDFHAHGKVQCL